MQASLPLVIVLHGTWVEKKTYPGRARKKSVIGLTVHGMGHTWPPRSGQIPKAGKGSGNIDATRVIVDFFLEHARER